MHWDLGTALHLCGALVDDVPPAPADQAGKTPRARREMQHDLRQHVRGEVLIHGVRIAQLCALDLF